MIIYYKNKYRIYGNLIHVAKFTSCYTIKQECIKCPLYKYCLNDMAPKDIFLYEIMRQCSYNELAITYISIPFPKKYSYFIKNISPINMHKLFL